MEGQSSKGKSMIFIRNGEFVIVLVVSELYMYLWVFLLYINGLILKHQGPVVQSIVSLTC